jgi:NADH-quinone oxidoreductase subunit N
MLSITSIISVTIIAIGLLFFGVFISQSGKLTHFINFLIVIYLSYFLWLDNSGLFYTNMVGNAVSPFDFLQEDSLYFRFFVMYTTIILIVFFIGISDRFFRSKSTIFEFPRLILFLHFGGLFTLYRNNFRDIFLAIELVTLTSYVLITFERQNRFSTYAGIQYFILGSLPSAMILIAFGLFYPYKPSLF